MLITLSANLEKQISCLLHTCAQLCNICHHLITLKLLKSQIFVLTKVSDFSFLKITFGLTLNFEPLKEKVFRCVSISRTYPETDNLIEVTSRICQLSYFLNIMICIFQNTSVAGRQPPGEEVGMVARFQPPTKVVVAQFQTFLATPGNFLSTF